MKTTYIFLVILLAISYGYSQQIQWIKGMGSSLSENARDITFDNSGNKYLAISFEDSLSLNTTSGLKHFISKGSRDYLIFKINDQEEIQWINQIGSDGQERTIDLEFRNNQLIAGVSFTNSLFINSNEQSFSTTPNSDNQVVLNINSNGDINWVEHIPFARFIGLTVDEFQNIYAFGEYRQELTFIINNQNFTLPTPENKNGYIQKMNSQGHSILVKHFTSTDFISPTKVEIDSEQNIYCSGSFDGQIILDTNNSSDMITSLGDSDIFIVKLDAEGNVIWNNQIASSGFDFGSNIKLINDQQLIICGRISGNNFIRSLSKDNFEQWEIAGFELNNLDYVRINSIAAKTNTGFFVTGVFIGTIDFSAGAGEGILVNPDTQDGNGDCFIAKYSNNGELEWAHNISGIENEEGIEIKLNQEDEIILLGSYSNNLIAHPTTGNTTLESNGKADIFYSLIKDDEYSAIKNINDYKVNTYPNPVTHLMSISIPPEIGNLKSIFIINTRSGIKTKAKCHQSGLLDISHYPNGLYTLIIESDKGNIYKRKFVITK